MPGERQAAGLWPRNQCRRLWDTHEARPLPLRRALRRQMDATSLTQMVDDAGDVLQQITRLLASQTE